MAATTGPQPARRPAGLPTRPAWGALAVNVALGAASMAALVDIPLFARATVTPTRRWRPRLVLVRFLVACRSAPWLGGALCRWRTLAPWIVAAGMALAAASFVGLASGRRRRWAAGPARSDVELVVGGLGFGLAIAPLNVAILGQSAPGSHALGQRLGGRGPHHRDAGRPVGPHRDRCCAGSTRRRPSCPHRSSCAPPRRRRARLTTPWRPTRWCRSCTPSSPGPRSAPSSRGLTGPAPAAQLGGSVCLHDVVRPPTMLGGVGTVPGAVAARLALRLQVTEARLVPPDQIRQPGGHVWAQLLQLVGGQRVGRPRRSQPGVPQTLVGDQIADSARRVWSRSRAFSATGDRCNA